MNIVSKFGIKGMLVIIFTVILVNEITLYKFSTLINLIGIGIAIIYLDLFYKSEVVKNNEEKWGYLKKQLESLENKNDERCSYLKKQLESLENNNDEILIQHNKDLENFSFKLNEITKSLPTKKFRDEIVVNSEEKIVMINYYTNNLLSYSEMRRDGKILIIAFYKEGKITVSKTFTEHGVLASENYFYSSGEIQRRITYSSTGKIIDDENFVNE